MKFCQPHWDALKSAIKAKGIADFIAPDAAEAMKQVQGELEGEKKTKKNFDPLMAAHWMIVNNAMRMIGDVGGNPLHLMVGNPEHPEHECPICYLNFLSLEHDRTCDNPDCTKPKGQTMDHWIDWAARDAAEILAGLPDE